MRASTLFILVVAVLIGVGVAAGGKYAGWFTQPDAAPEATPIQVLAARQTIFKGNMINSNQVAARALSPSEVEDYKKDPKKYLPPTTGAVSLRIAARDITANEVLTVDDLAPMEKPEPLHTRLLSNMRGVNVAVTKDRSVGGLIQVGEWVDVHLTTTIQAPGSDEEITRTAPVATGVRVIAKRNALWPVFAPLPDDKPVEYTLEMNAYRAALVEFSKNNGYLSLVPVSESEMGELEAERNQLLQMQRAGQKLEPGLVPVGLNDNEDRERIQLITRGDLTVGSEDLVRIFGLQPPKVETPQPPEKRIEIQQFIGTRYQGPVRFNQEGDRVGGSESSSTGATGADGVRSASRAARTSAFRFNSPDEECKTCGNKNKQ